MTTISIPGKISFIIVSEFQSYRKKVKP